MAAVARDRARARQAMRAAHKATQPKLRKGDKKAAAWEVMEDAYHEAAGGTGVANARQVFYVARRLVQAILPEGTAIKDKYFTQHLLPDFIEAHPELTKDRTSGTTPAAS